MFYAFHCIESWAPPVRNERLLGVTLGAHGDIRRPNAHTEIIKGLGEQLQSSWMTLHAFPHSGVLELKDR